ncbi:MAG: TraR/DksA C4-type zinc finger protein [Candidatus Berkelbacteria bacterium]|nr:TraR/DksA C4-type zinc finger protein [Candidatus Berkelbacteria bacterium]
MDKEFLEKVKKSLEAKKANLEARLSETAKKEDGDHYATRFPNYGDDEESAVSEVEDYDTNVDIENNLVKDLRATNAALKRIEEENYGICLKCSKQIEPKRLEAYPAASVCLNCKKR